MSSITPGVNPPEYKEGGTSSGPLWAHMNTKDGLFLKWWRMPHLSNFLFFCDSGVLHWKQITSADEPPPSALSPHPQTKKQRERKETGRVMHGSSIHRRAVTHFCPVLARLWAPHLVNHPECCSFTLDLKQRRLCPEDKWGWLLAQNERYRLILASDTI